MGQAKRRKLSGDYRTNLDILHVGYGGLCGECDRIHEPEPCPFSYTVGLTERGWPELIFLAPKADSGVAQDVNVMLRELAVIAARRGRGFKDGDHVHQHELSIRQCVAMHEPLGDPSDPDGPFSLGAAIQRYGAGRFSALLVATYGKPYWLKGVSDDEITAAITSAAP